jgi:selenide,water dikinase
VLRPLQTTFPPNEYPNLLVGLGQPDDAAVYQVDESRAIISTMDFFAPVVDNPYDFGAIAAANALSDVYAMGGKPLMAINLVAYSEAFEIDILSEILRGGAEKAKEAGIAIAGGHTVTDKEPKYGLSVTGEVHPQKIIRKSGAQVGDALILTKPLGIGVITTALKRGVATLGHVATATAGMSRLNRYAAEVAQKYNEALGAVVRAMTDITGYGLAGHAHELAHMSQVALRIQYDHLLWYGGSATYAQQDTFAGGTYRNQEYYEQWVQFETSLQDWQQDLLYDPQTSGGLLMAVQPEYAEPILSELMAVGEQAAMIGEVVAGDGVLRIV